MTLMFIMKTQFWPTSVFLIQNVRNKVDGILQARILELGAIPFSMGTSDPEMEPRSPALQADSVTI